MFQKIKKTVNTPGFLKYFRNTSWLIGEQILRILSGVLVGIWVARYLGPSQFGVFSYALAFSAIFSGVAKMGLDGVVVRELTLHPNLKNEYLGTAFWLKLAGAILVLLLISVILLFTSNDSLTKTYILIISLGLVFQSFEVVDFYFQSKVMSRVVSICKILQLFISSLLKVYLVIANADLIWFVMITVFDSATLAICLLYAYKLNGNSSFYKYFNKSFAVDMLKDSWPLIISSIAVMMYMRIDQIMIKDILGDHEVGLYSAAVKLSEVWYFLPVVIANSLFPAILNAKRISFETYQFRLQQLYNLMVLIGFGTAIFTTILGDWVVRISFGYDYAAASAILVIHIWTGIFVNLGVASGKWLLSERLTVISLQRTLSGMILNIGLNLILIPRYGAIGAAIGTLISQVLATYLFDFFHKKTKEMFYMKTKAIFLRFLV